MLNDTVLKGFFLKVFRDQRAEKSLGRAKKRPAHSKKHAHYLSRKEHARRLVHAKLHQWNDKYGFAYGKVAIRDQRSRWGSCSKKGNLNFNYRILLLPEHLADYVIVHELCHLKEFNHSKAFWALVGETLPDHAKRRKELSELSRRGYTLVRA